MIQDKANALVTLIGRQAELRRDLHLLDGFRNQSEAITAAATRLEELLVVWRMFAARGIASSIATSECSALLRDLEVLRDRFEEDPGYILNAANRLMVVRNSIPSFAQKLEQELLAAWGIYVVSRSPGVNAEVLSVLANIGSLRRRVEAVTAGLRDLDQRGKRLPVNSAEAEEFDRKAEKLSAAWRDLDTEHLRSDVLSFLRDAGSLTGAPIASLTDEVKRWLDEHELMPSFRIRSTASSQS